LATPPAVTEDETGEEEITESSEEEPEE